MKNTFEYINIREVLSRALRHPLLKDVNLETAILYVIDFIGIVGLTDIYETREDVIDIKLYKGLIPCPLISINGAKKIPEGVSLKAMSNIFNPKVHHHHHCCNDFHHTHKDYELTYKVLNRIIITGFEEGKILLNYSTLKLDEDGMPMIIDEPNFLKALEDYIKKEVFQIKFDMLEISQASLQSALLAYAWSVARFMSMWKTPDIDEMESIKGDWTSLVQNVTHHRNGFKDMHRTEYLLNH